MSKETPPPYEHFPSAGNLDFIVPADQNAARHESPQEAMENGGHFHSLISDVMGDHIESVRLVSYIDNGEPMDRIGVMLWRALDNGTHATIGVESTYNTQRNTTQERVVIQVIDEQGQPRERHEYSSRGALVRRWDSDDVSAGMQLGVDATEESVAFEHYMGVNNQRPGGQELHGVREFISGAEPFRPELAA